MTLGRNYPFLPLKEIVGHLVVLRNVGLKQKLFFFYKSEISSLLIFPVMINDCQ